MGTTAAKETNAAPSATPISENEELLSGKIAQSELDEKYAFLKSFPPKGYRVLGVQAQSPASFTGLVAYFDFIVAANNIPLKSMDTTFISLIKASEDKPLTLTVYNCKNHSLREVVIVPSRKWPGEGMLGVTIRFDEDYRDAEDQVIHILEVEANSPADIAGLQPGADYLLGTAERSFKDTEVLFEDLKKNLEHPLEVYVYSSESDEVRSVIILPTEEWGGEGILGANVAFGFLHRLPKKSCLTLGRYVDNNTNKAIHSPFGDRSLDVLSVPAEITTAPRTPTAKDNTDLESSDTFNQEPRNLIQGINTPPTPAVGAAVVVNH